MPCSYINRYGNNCQFSVHSDDIVEFDNRHWCPFHLPLKAKEKWQDKQVATFNNKILLKIADSTDGVDLSGVVFIGNIDFSGIDFGRGDIDFSEAKFGKGTVNFSEANFGKANVNFSETNFAGAKVNFTETNFGEGNVNFTETNFGGAKASFSKLQLKVIGKNEE